MHSLLKKILDLPLRSSPEKREKLAPIPQANYKETGRDTEILEINRDWLLP